MIFIVKHFCTYFDHNYISKGIALYISLIDHCNEFTLWVLPLSEKCFDIMRHYNLKNISLISLQDLEKVDPELLKAKNNRSLIEYYYTLTPSLPLFILNKNKNIDLITHLDSDLYFFSSVEPIFEEIKNSSIAIMEHRFTNESLHLKNGVYNVSWISYRRDSNGMKCLEWYRDRCNEWCYQKLSLIVLQIKNTWNTLMNYLIMSM